MTHLLIEEKDEFIYQISKLRYSTSYTNRGIYYINLPISMDIETSSFKEFPQVNSPEKVAITYTITIDINHIIYICREWNEYIDIMSEISEIFRLTDKKRCIIYVHNLSYEFQFMRKFFEWDKIFALDKREVVYAITNGVEYRCSYLLSGYSLENLAEINSLPIRKLKGDLDYKKIRTPLTPLTNEEKNYIINDVEIIIYYIEKLLITYPKIFNIPITKTQFVRRYTRSNTDNYKYNNIIKGLTIEPYQYQYLRSSFYGGFTHSNFINNKIIIPDVSSFDLTSAYPAVMIMEMFPMSKAYIIDEPSNNDIQESLKYYCSIFAVTYEELESKNIGDNIISSSRCKITGSYETDNGRLVRADLIGLCVTDLDFKSIDDFYTYKKRKVYRIIRYYKNYLPKDFVLSILNLYEQKTKLKGVENKEDEYINTKEMLNSMYGMTVTDILRDEIIYDNDEWSNEEPNLDKAILKYNNSKKRFLYYPWGIWVTAYVRRIIWNTIKNIQHDYVYSDTDSVKLMHIENHKDYFDDYNEYVKQKVSLALSYHNIDIEKAKPKTIDGKEKFIGLFEYEGTYKYFKTLGAKRYMYIDNSNHLNLTVSGLNKNAAVPYILETLNIPYEKDGKKFKLFHQVNYKKIFDFFDDGMFIPAGHTGKQTHTYIDEEKRGIVKDYLGQYYVYYSPSGVHLEEAEYELSLETMMLKAIMGIRDKIK